MDFHSTVARPLRRGLDIADGAQGRVEAEKNAYTEKKKKKGKRAILDRYQIFFKPKNTVPLPTRVQCADGKPLRELDQNKPLLRCRKNVPESKRQSVPNSENGPVYVSENGR